MSDSNNNMQTTKSSGDSSTTPGNSHENGNGTSGQINNINNDSINKNRVVMPTTAEEKYQVHNNNNNIHDVEMQEQSQQQQPSKPQQNNNNNNNNNNNQQQFPYNVTSALEGTVQDPDSAVAGNFPAPIQYLYDIIFVSTLQPKDTFEIALRKMAICAGFIGFPMPIACAIYWIILAATDANAAVTALVIAAVTCIVMSVCSIAIYYYVRSTKTASSLLLSVYLTAAIVFVAGVTICIPHFPNATILMGVAEISVLTRADWFTLHMLLCSILYIIASYNVTFVNFGQWTLLTLPNPHRGSTVENVLLIVVGWIVLLLVTAALYLQYVEYLRLVNKSSSTSQMGWTVAGHLRQWDLAAVEKTLTKYHSLPHSDDIVLNQFTHIVQTIRDFSVYLPREIISGILSSGESVRDAQFKSKHVAVMFIEISNFPALCDSVPSSDLSRLLRMYHDTVTSALTAHEGVVVKLSGPSLVVLWGAPRPCEKRAGQACLAAMHVIAAVEDELVAKFEAEGFALSVRIGINSGNAMVGAVGSRDRASYSANGSTINLAGALAKLARRVQRSAVLVTQTTLREAQEQITALRFVTREAADIRTKRQPQPQLAHQIVGFTDRRVLSSVPGFSSSKLLDNYWAFDGRSEDLLKRINDARATFDRALFPQAAQIYDQLLSQYPTESSWPIPLRRHGVDSQMVQLLAHKSRRYISDPPEGFDGTTFLEW